MDGQFILGVDEEIVLRLGLRVGQEISEEELNKIVQEEQIRKAKDSAFSLLSYRARSEQEIRQRLHQKEYPDDVIDPVIQDLIRLGLIDDSQFAKDWVESRLRSRPTGKTRLAIELRKKGIHSNVLENALESIDSDDEVAMALEIATHKNEKMRDEDTSTRRRHLASLLQRRGFSWEIIRTVLEKIFSDEYFSS